MPRAPPSISSSSSSIAGALAGVGRQITGNKSDINIHIDNHYAAKVYTSGTTVAGHVTVVNPGPKDLRFDHMQITLCGFTKTRVNGPRGPQESKHHFLELHMPIAEESYPVPRVYEADQSYSVPFTFVIPDNLVLGPCAHRCDNINVQEQHRALPPSMGHWQKDDMAPEMARVHYAIMAHVYRESESEENRERKKKTVSLLKTTQPINVLPAFPEQPPLGIAKRDKEYVMAKSKSIKKNLLSPKSGELTVTAIQPAAAMLSPDGRAARTTNVTLDFHFDPSTTQSATPKILQVGGKLTAHTYFSLAGVGYMPNMGDWVKTYGIEGRGAYEGAVALPDLPVKHVEWNRDLHPRSRRDSGYGSEEHATSGSDTAGKSRQTSPFSYSATLQVPVDLPVQRKAFLPTFHSCMASRAYILALNVVVSSGSSNNTTTFTLKVPLQIGVEPTRQPALGVPPSFEAAVEEAAVEGPSVQHRDELPGYSESR